MCDELVNEGATFKQPKEIAQEADYIFMMLGYPHDVRNMVLDKESGILQHMKPGSTLIDCTTSSPELAQQIAAQGLERGIHSVDAPVSGGDIGARKGCVASMVGGSEEGVNGAMDLMQAYSVEVAHMGEAGSGQYTKLCNQMMLATTMVGVCEALLLAQKAGVNHEKMIELLGKGGASSFTVLDLAPRMINRNFGPGFYVEYFVKDLGICLDECRRMNLSVPGTAQAFQLYEMMMAQDRHRMGH